jgi:hypothetical protein
MQPTRTSTASFGQLIAHVRRMRVLPVMLLVGCGYRPGSFNSSIVSFSGQLATVGCLDVAVDRKPDMPSGEAVLAYSFGNRCDFPTLVDLAATTVVGRDPEGHDLDLERYDPSHAVAPLRIDGRAVGREAIAYTHGPPLAEVWVDVGAIGHSGPTWLHLTNISNPEVQ